METPSRRVVEQKWSSRSGSPKASGKRPRRFGGTGHGTGWGIDGQVETGGKTLGEGTWADLEGQTEAGTA